MQRKFFTNLILLIFLNLLIKPFWIFGVEVGVQNAVGESTYGFYFVILNLTLVLNILLDLGITNYNNKNIAQHHYLLQKHLGNIIAIRFVLFAFYSLVIFIIALFLGYGTYKMYLLSILVFNQFLASFILYLRSNLSGLHLFITDSFISVMDKTLMILIMSILLWSGWLHQDFKIEWFVYAQTVSFGLTFLVTLIAVLRKSGRISIKFDYTFFVAFFKQSYPYAFLILLMAFYNRFDSVLIDALLPTQGSGVLEASTGHFQAGIYAQAFRILDGATQFGYLFAGLLLPIFAKMIKNKERVEEMVVLSYSLIIVPAIILSVTGSLFAQDLMSLLYHQGSEYSGPVFRIIFLGFISISTTYIFGTLLTANGSVKQLNIMALAGIATNLLINIILIPRFEALGAAYASLATQSFTALAQIIIAWYIFKFKFNYQFISKILILLTFTVLSSLLIKSQIPQVLWAIGLIVMVNTLFAFSIKLLNFKNLITILKYRE